MRESIALDIETPSRAASLTAAPPLTMRTRRGAAALGAAILLGLLGDLLLRALPWGINVFLWVGTLVLAVVWVARRGEVPLTGGGRWLVAPLLFFAAAYAWRDATLLMGLTLLALLTTLALAASHTRTGRLRVAGLVDYATSLLTAFVFGVGGILMLGIGEIDWKSLPRTGWTRWALAIGRGLLLTLPLLILFGALFMAADAIFEGIVNDLLDIDLFDIALHLFLIGFYTWLVGGFLYQSLLHRQHEESLPRLGAAPFGLGIIEVGMVLGALNLLFLAFVLVQFRYFFGGAALIQVTGEFTYAEYARRGFFELVTVAALLMPLLLLAHWLLRPQRPAHTRLFQFLATTLILLLFVVMASALQRMRLYMDAFGLTELRLYTTAFMGWLAVLFVWFGATVLRGQRQHFAFGALATAYVTLALLLVLNPDALIMRTNLNRIGVAPTPFDRSYALSLSADAIPPLIEALPRMDEANRCATVSHLISYWGPETQRPDWRSWNWSRARARQIVAANQEMLESFNCPGRG